MKYSNEMLLQYSRALRGKEVSTVEAASLPDTRNR